MRESAKTNASVHELDICVGTRPPSASTTHSVPRRWALYCQRSTRNNKSIRVIPQGCAAAAATTSPLLEASSQPGGIPNASV